MKAERFTLSAKKMAKEARARESDSGTGMVGGII